MRVGLSFVRIIDLLPHGLVDYIEVDHLQRAYHTEVLAGGEDTLIISQFTPTWTAGRHTRPEDIPDTTVPVVHVDRAGSATWHGPGQVVIYPIVRLREPVDTLKWIRSVEAGVLHALTGQWKLPVERIEGRAGVWLREQGRRDRKICAIGLKVARGVTLHGIALNVNIDMAHAFRGIIPCGLVDADVASLHMEGVHTDMETVAQVLIHHLVESIADCLASSSDHMRYIRDLHDLPTTLTSGAH
nr:lipoyl(octanoyl) transferase LipB [Schaalia sp. lx-260]